MSTMSSTSKEIFSVTFLFNPILLIIVFIIIALLLISVELEPISKYSILFFLLILILFQIYRYITGNALFPFLKAATKKSTSVEDGITVESDNVKEITAKPQVFNIPENTYTYEDAQAVCKAYGSRLATYSEIESAYQKGGEWCNYGWSDGQMALFPTQQNTWNNLQHIEGHQHDCGRPGINGGYMANPDLKFGVNCYGYKPRMTPEEEELMATQPLYPKSEKDIAMEKQVSYWKTKLSQILVSPFNSTTWSRL